MKTYVVGTHLKRLDEALLSTHNISFRGKIRKMSIFFSGERKTPYLELCESTITAVVIAYLEPW